MTKEREENRDKWNSKRKKKREIIAHYWQILISSKSTQISLFWNSKTTTINRY